MVPLFSLRDSRREISSRDGVGSHQINRCYDAPLALDHIEKHLPLITFDAARALVQGGRTPHLLLGNGFSRAWRDDIFAYTALFERADFGNLSPSARQAFDRLGTTDFEVVMRTLRDAAQLIPIYAPDRPDIAAQLQEDANGLREVLVRAIAENHPEYPAEIAREAFAACRQFLSLFDKIYTLNYDLLLYWALMQNEIPPLVRSDDGFRTPEDGQQEYVTWEPGRHGQNVYYLHGALHIFDGGIEVQKYTWMNTGIRLIDQIREALNNNIYPIFVAEGESRQKYERIRHSDLLSKAYRSFQEIGNALFVYGHAMAPNDNHIVRLIGQGKLRQLFVGIYGDEMSTDNQLIWRKVEELQAMRPAHRPLEAVYFDARTARVWG